MEIFSLNSYRGIIDFSMKSALPKTTKMKLAQRLNCSPSWLTRVLKGEAQITPDQGYGICHHFRFSGAEEEYFMLLVELERATTVRYKERLKEKIRQIQRQQKGVGKAIKSTRSISESVNLIYRSNWTYMAIHFACVIRPMTESEMESTLGLASGSIGNELKFLQGQGLIAQSDGRWSYVGDHGTFVDSTSPMKNIALASMRNHSIEHLRNKTEDDIHFSSMYAISHEDREKFYKRLRSVMLDSFKEGEKSKPETLVFLNLDFYSPGIKNGVK